MSAVISDTEESAIGQPFDSVRDYVNALDARGRLLRIESMDQDQYDRLIVRYLSNEASPEDRLALKQWLDTSPAHRLQFTEAEQLWKTAAPTEFERPVTLDDAWSEMEETLDLTPDIHDRIVPLTRSRFAAWHRHALAAAAVLLVVISILLFLNLNNKLPLNQRWISKIW